MLHICHFFEVLVADFYKYMTKGYWKLVKELKQPNALLYYCRLYVYYCLIADITSTVNFLSYFCSIYVLNLTEDTQSS